MLTRIVGPSQRISLPQPTNPQHNKAPFLLSCCPIAVHVSVSVSDGLDRYQLFLALTIPVSRVVSVEWCMRDYHSNQQSPVVGFASLPHASSYLTDGCDRNGVPASDPAWLVCLLRLDCLACNPLVYLDDFRFVNL